MVMIIAMMIMMELGKGWVHWNWSLLLVNKPAICDGAQNIFLFDFHHIGTFSKNNRLDKMAGARK